MDSEGCLPPGAVYVTNFVDDAEQCALVASVDASAWITDLRRRVQHYGYRYDYRARRVTEDRYLGPLPEWSVGLASKMTEAGWFSSTPDQLIVNEYQPGQGIAAHVDCIPCFGETIASVSLLSPCEMKFRHLGTGEVFSLILEPSSALLLSGQARLDWTHEIPSRKSDVIDGKQQRRSRRISLTFRTVTLD